MENIIQVLDVGGGIAMRGGLFAVCNLKIMMGLCLLCAACGRESVSISESDLSRFRQFLSESLAFDYCGCHFMDDDVRRASKKFPREDLIGFHLVEHGYLDQSIDYLHLLESFERNAMLGSENDAMEDAVRIKDSLRSQRNAVLSPKKKFSPFRYERNVRQLLFSVVRIRESGCCPKDLARTIVNAVLGNELFDLDVSKCDWIHAGSDWLSRLKLFRDFVLLSFHIVETGAESSGVEAYAIGKVEDARLAGVMRKRTFRFVSDGNGWNLLWVRAGFVGDFLERFSLVPQVNGITCISDDRTDLRGVVYLSSDFSSRRREIFRRGEILRGAHLTVGKEFIEVDKSHSAVTKEKE